MMTNDNRIIMSKKAAAPPFGDRLPLMLSFYLALTEPLPGQTVIRIQESIAFPVFLPGTYQGLLDHINESANEDAGDNAHHSSLHLFHYDLIVP